jgi:hypothetical protein
MIVLSHCVHGLGADFELGKRAGKRRPVLKAAERRQDVDIGRACLVGLELVFGCIAGGEIFPRKRPGSVRIVSAKVAM